MRILRHVEKLKLDHIPEAQAKAEAAVLATALGESASGHLATEEDITSIKIEMADIRSELTLMKWLVAIGVAGVVSLVAKAFFS